MATGPAGVAAAEGVDLAGVERAASKSAAAPEADRCWRLGSAGGGVGAGVWGAASIGWR